MSLDRFLIRPLLIRTAATVQDRYGNTVRDWTAATDVPAMGWCTQVSTAEFRDASPRRSVRSVGAADGRVVTVWHLYLAAGVSLLATDRVVAVDLGLVFEVDGEVHEAWTPTNGVHHLEADLNLVEG